MLKALIFSASLTLFAVALAPLGGGESCRQAAAAAQERAPDRAFNHSNELFFAVLEGLYVDGVSNEVVDAIIERDVESNQPANFVWGCPICMPAYEALRLYRARPRFESSKGLEDTFGPGLDAETTRRVTSPELAVKLEAIQELIERWTGRRMESLRLSDAEREVWQHEMEIGLKKGMSMLYSYKDGERPGRYKDMKACAFCEGANGACRKR